MVLLVLIGLYRVPPHDTRQGRVNISRRFPRETRNGLPKKSHDKKFFSTKKNIGLKGTKKSQESHKYHKL